MKRYEVSMLSKERYRPNITAHEVQGIYSAEVSCLSLTTANIHTLGRIVGPSICSHVQRKFS